MVRRRLATPNTHFSHLLLFIYLLLFIVYLIIKTHFIAKLVLSKLNKVSTVCSLFVGSCCLLVLFNNFDKHYFPQEAVVLH